MRLFIAIPLPETVRAELRRQQDGLKSRREAIHWAPDEQLHLTLRFVGETEKHRLEPVVDLLERLAERHRPLDLRLGSPGFFGSERSPRVLWTGLEGELAALETLARRLELGLQGLGFERAPLRFKPHLTLGRVKGCRPDLLAAHLGAPPLPVAFRAGEIRLIESTLKPSGAIHDVLTRHILSASEAAPVARTGNDQLDRKHP